MKVYVVTAGEYSDYHIEKVFTSRETAHLYSMMDSDRCVEEYSVDTVNVKTAKQYILVEYCYRYNYIRSMILYRSPVKPHITADRRHSFEFTMDLSNDRIRKNLMRYGKNSGVLKKIVQDTFAQYLYEHETTREELVRKDEEEYARRHGNYVMYKTSLAPLPDPVGEKLTVTLHQMFANNEPLPEPLELQQMADNIRKEADADEHD